MEWRKKVTFFTLALALLGFSCVVCLHFFSPKKPLVLKQSAFPTMGNEKAPVEIVLIEDFQCRSCRHFSRQVIPKIQEEFIRSGKARFILVPVSFLAGSQAMANAALEVYAQNPQKFFPYLKHILALEGQVGKEELLSIAKKEGGIQIDQLRACIESGCHNKELERNLKWAREMMGGYFRTPAIYINGTPGSTFSFEAIRYQIEQILGKS